MVYLPQEPVWTPDIYLGPTFYTCIEVARILSTGFYTGRRYLMRDAGVNWMRFMKCYCTQAEVKPLDNTPDGRFVVCDTTVNFDDNTLCHIHTNKITLNDDVSLDKFVMIK